MKVREDRWERTTYVWNDDETAASRAPGNGQERPDVEVGNGQDYRIPSGIECEQCHDGRKDNVLGFELISLGQAGASGLTVEQLVEDDLLSERPEQDEIVIGDDGTGRAAEALGWLHINCGVSCHNDDGNSEAFNSGLRLKLNPAQLDGRSSANFEILKSTVGIPAVTSRWNNQVRIVPGRPEESLLYQLISVRTSGKNNQMPPIATRVVPAEQVAMIADWIRRMDPAQVAAPGGGGPGPD
jgi:hypothetical protein